MNTRDLHRLIDLETQFKVNEIKTNIKDNKECDLINFKEDCSVASKRSKEMDKNKQIADYQIKMLEEFLKTTGNKTQNKPVITPEQNVQFQQFFDEYESKQKTNSNTQTKLLNTGTNQTAQNIIVIGNPTILIPKSTPKEEHDFKANMNLVNDLISETNSISQLDISKDHTKLKHEEISIKTGHSKPSEIKKKCDNFKTMMSEIMAKNDMPYAALSLNKNAFAEEKPDKSNQSCFKSTIDDKIKPNNAYINDLVNKDNIRYLEAIKKDDKKRCELVTDNEKVNLTPGPTLYEKSMFLPGIMQRLAERKEALDKSNVIQNAVNVNKNMKDFKTDAGPSKRANINFANLLDVSNYKTSDLKINGMAGSKTTNKKLQCTKDNKNIDYPPVESLRVLRKGLKGLSELQSSNSDDDLRVLKPPEVLMENCNKQRYIAHAASRLFEDFIKSG